MNTLRSRCHAFLKHLGPPMRPGRLDRLVEFVVAENGRKAADGKLDEALPLCLYFATDVDRDEFIAVIRAERPDLIAKKV